MNDQLSLGLGVSAMWTEATLTRQVNRRVAAESDVEIKVDDWGYGFNLGAIYQSTADTRFGVAYRSKVKQELEGEAKFVATLSTNDSDVTASVDLPENFSASVFSRVNDKGDVMADVTWTRWSRFEELGIKPDSGAPDIFTGESWYNMMRYSIGLNYYYSDAIKLRAGLAYDEEAIKGEFRTTRISGNDRKWVALGASYTASPTSKFDIGYTHLFISDAKINAVDEQAPNVNGRVRGDFEGSVDILSLQYTHNF